MRKFRVLVADDDLLSRAMVAATLQNGGFEVELAADGEEAWALLQRDDAPRLAILDWDMPGVDGLEIIRRLRAAPRSARIYVILLTSRSASADAAAAHAAGADDFVVKPPRLEDLIARVRAGERVAASATS